MGKLREGDVALGQSLTVAEVFKKLQVSEQTYCRWRHKYGGMSPAAIQELKALQKAGVSRGDGGWTAITTGRTVRWDG